MATADHDLEYVSLAPLFGQNSMEAFLQALTERTLPVKQLDSAT